MIKHGVTGSSGLIASMLKRLACSLHLQMNRAYGLALLVSSFSYCNWHSLSAIWCFLTILFVYLFRFYFSSTMAMTLGASTACRPRGFSNTPSTLDMYSRRNEGFLNTKRPDAMFSSGNAETMYHTRSCFDRDTALGAGSRRWSHRGRRGAALQNDDNRYLAILFIRYEEKYDFASRPADVIRQAYSLSLEDLPTAGLYHFVDFTALSRYFLSIFNDHGSKI